MISTRTISLAASPIKNSTASRALALVAAPAMGAPSLGSQRQRSMMGAAGPQATFSTMNNSKNISSTQSKMHRLSLLQQQVRELTAQTTQARRQLHTRGQSPESRRSFSTIDNGTPEHQQMEQELVATETLNNMIEQNMNYTYTNSTACESKMCMNALQEVLSSTTDGCDSDYRREEAKILDFGAGQGQLGQMLADQGFNQVYAQEGSNAKKQMLKTKGIYKDIETFIVGKQGLPPAYRRQFDIVTCATSLGTNLLPSKSFEDMLLALKSGGFVVFTVSHKHLVEGDSFNMGYQQAIERLITRGSWRPVSHRQFVKNHGVSAGNSEELYSLLVFQKA